LWLNLFYKYFPFIVKLFCVLKNDLSFLQGQLNFLSVFSQKCDSFSSCIEVCDLLQDSIVWSSNWCPPCHIIYIWTLYNSLPSLCLLLRHSTVSWSWASVMSLEVEQSCLPFNVASPLLSLLHFLMYCRVGFVSCLLRLWWGFWWIREKIWKHWYLSILSFPFSKFIYLYYCCPGGTL
jgi:hypothetical protein